MCFRTLLVSSLICSRTYFLFLIVRGKDVILQCKWSLVRTFVVNKEKKTRNQNQYRSFMNQYIVSQWFKYKANLEEFYQKNSTKECNECFKYKTKLKNLYCDLCVEKVDVFEKFKGNCIRGICVEVLNHLLDLVINQGENPLQLRLVDASSEHIVGGCWDTMYFLRDGRGQYWVISTFYGTHDTMLRLEGLSKKQWLTLLMHLSLGMIQKLRRCDELMSNSLIVSSKGSCICTISYLINLKGLGRLGGMYRWYLLKTLEDLPRKLLDPLFTLMSAEQKKEIEDLLDNVNVEENKLFDELTTVQHPTWIMALMGNERADLLIEKMVEFGLKGYLAICFREDRRLGELHYRREESYQEMEEYDSNFKGNSCFIAIGSTLTQLMKDIERKSGDESLI